MTHEIQSDHPDQHGKDPFASASATANALNGIAPPGQAPDQASTDTPQHSEVLDQAKEADRLFAEALDYESTRRIAWDAHIEGGRKSASDKAQRSATVVEPGATLDLQQSSHLSDTDPSGRSIAREPLIVTLRDPSGGDAVKVAYDNQVLARIPATLDENGIRRERADSWQGHVRNQFNLPPSRHLEPGVQADAGTGHVDIHRALGDAARAVVDDNFAQSQAWSYEDSVLPTTLVVGQAFGGNVGELAGLEVAEVSVPAAPLQRAGKLDNPSLTREYNEAPSPHIMAAALLEAVHERRGPAEVVEPPQGEAAIEGPSGHISET